MPRCEGTRAPVLKAGESLIRIMVSAPESGARYGNFYFNTRNEPIDVTIAEMAGLKTDTRLAIMVPGEMAAESVEKDTRIAMLLQENVTLKGRIVELEGQVKDRDALLRKSAVDLDEATKPAQVRGTLSVTEPGADDKNRRNGPRA